MELIIKFTDIELSELKQVISLLQPTVRGYLREELMHIIDLYLKKREVNYSINSNLIFNYFYSSKIIIESGGPQDSIKSWFKLAK